MRLPVALTVAVASKAGASSDEAWFEHCEISAHDLRHPRGLTQLQVSVLLLQQSARNLRQTRAEASGTRPPTVSTVARAIGSSSQGARVRGMGVVVSIVVMVRSSSSD